MMADQDPASGAGSVEPVPGRGESRAAPARVIRRAFVLLLISFVSVVVGFVSPWGWSCFCMPLAMLLGLGVFVTARRLKPARDAAPGNALDVIRRVRNWLTVLGITTFVGSVFLSLGSLALARVIAKSPISLSHLRGIGMAMREYCKEHGDYPPTLHALIDAELAVPAQFLAPSDVLSDDDIAELQCSSYVYLGGRGEWRPDPDLILAYERVPLSVVGGSPFRPAWAQAVLFGDGEVRPLTPDDMAQAILRDRQKRHELGWPQGQ